MGEARPNSPSETQDTSLVSGQSCQRSLRVVEKAPRPLRRLLEVRQLEAAAGGRFEGLLGVVVEVVVVQAAMGRCKREGAPGVRAHAAHPWAKEGGRGRGPRGVRGRGWQRRGCWRGGEQATCAVYMCRLCVGRARAGLILTTRREWRVAFKARAGRC